MLVTIGSITDCFFNPFFFKYNGTPATEVMKLFSCSTEREISMLIKGKMVKKIFPALKLSDVVFILLINVKMPTIVGIQVKFQAQLG